MNPQDFTITDERAVIGRYKALGLTDPDTIYNQKTTILTALKSMRMMTWFMFIFGFFPTVIFIGWMAVGGDFSFMLFIISAFFNGGGYYFMRSRKIKTAIVNNATAKYCQELGIAPV